MYMIDVYRSYAVQDTTNTDPHYLPARGSTSVDPLSYGSHQSHFSIHVHTSCLKRHFAVWSLNLLLTFISFKTVSTRLLQFIKSSWWVMRVFMEHGKVFCNCTRITGMPFTPTTSLRRWSSLAILTVFKRKTSSLWRFLTTWAPIVTHQMEQNRGEAILRGHNRQCNRSDGNAPQSQFKRHEDYRRVRDDNMIV